MHSHVTIRAGKLKYDFEFYFKCEIREGILKTKFSFYIDTDSPIAWLISITHF